MFCLSVLEFVEEVDVAYNHSKVALVYGSKRSELLHCELSVQRGVGLAVQDAQLTFKPARYVA